MPVTHGLSPRTPVEMLRISHALLGCNRLTGNQVWIVMRRGGNYDVYLVTDDETKATDAAAAPGAHDDVGIYGPFPWDPSAPDRFDPIGHIFFTMKFPPLRRGTEPRLDQIDGFTLQVHVRGGAEVTYDFPEGTDAIFLTRRAREMFLDPSYSSFFGPRLANDLDLT
jgi:hypothetical protein